MGGECLLGTQAMEVNYQVLLLESHIQPAAALQASIQFDPGFTATSIIHPATYLNKVLVASNEGSLQLWNIRTQCVVYLVSLP